MNILDLLQGFVIGSSLIIAIGPQNLFVINQGIKRKYILITVLICSLSDSLLIVCGIYLSNNILSLNTSIITIMKLIGGIWLILYGINKIKNSRNHVINNKEFNEVSFIKIVMTTLAITYANPQVYLDTVILLGSISINFDSKLYFGLGEQHAMTLEEIGETFDLTRERVRQIKEKAIRRLKHTSRSKILKTYLG